MVSRTRRSLAWVAAATLRRDGSGFGAWVSCSLRCRRSWSLVLLDRSVGARIEGARLEGDTSSRSHAVVVGVVVLVAFADRRDLARSLVEHLARVDDLPHGLDDVPPVVAGHPDDREDLERIEPPRPGREHPGQGHVLVRVGDRAQRLLEVPDLGRVEQRQPADDGVRDVLVAQPGDDRLAVAMLAIQDRDVRPGSFRCCIPVRADQLADPVRDRDGLVVRAGAHDEGHGLAVPAPGVQLLAGLVAHDVVVDQPIGGGEDMAAGAVVLLEAEPGRTAGRRRTGVVDGRVCEATIELGESGVAGAAEAVDRLVVVAHGHHVVGSIGRATQQLDELDLGDVRVLELVHQQVPEPALVAAQDVRPLPEQADHGGDLLPESSAPRRWSSACRRRTRGRAVEAQDLERPPSMT